MVSHLLNRDVPVREHLIEGATRRTCRGDANSFGDCSLAELLDPAPSSRHDLRNVSSNTPANLAGVNS